ncbi:MAG TPA: 4-hydroxy-tetrahydrodipicolinate reductase [Devosiaceae bacterium]|nr:4-hydroxy-tetrahydrodipicolinate reductase [Devosiaceae bacterium]
MTDLKIAIAGAGGRMGGANIRAVMATDGLVLHSAFARGGSGTIGKDAGVLAGSEPLGVIVTDDVGAALAGAGAIIDFTTPAASVALAERAAQAGLVHVIGTTGLSADDEAAIAAAARNGARIVKAGNFSLGVNLLQGLVKKAAQVLGEDFDIEIVEMHHNRKVDAPSGTALMLGEAAAKGRGIALAEHSIRGRDGLTGPRPKGEIGFAALRGGTVVGEHAVILAGDSERIELTHRAESRAIFANGAMRAALWARTQPAGLYSMADVLGFSD